MFKILAIGDICGQAAVSYLADNLPRFIKYEGIDLVVANGENAALNGITQIMAEQLQFAGVDVITGGNHIFDKRDSHTLFDDLPYLIRPINYPYRTGIYDAAPGVGYRIVETKGVRTLVVNAQGRVHIEPPLDDPFVAVEDALTYEAGNYDIAVLDFHAEATSEKFAMGYLFDGRITAIYGTHTHVPTADEYIMPKGSGYITDIGMTGPLHSALGVDADIILRRFRTAMPTRHAPAETAVRAQGGLFCIDNSAAIVKCISVNRVEF